MHENQNEHLEACGEVALLLASAIGHLDVVCKLLKLNMVNVKTSCTFGGVALGLANRRDHLEACL